jgi:hypothetical protein
MEQKPYRVGASPMKRPPGVSSPVGQQRQVAAPQARSEPNVRNNQKRHHKPIIIGMISIVVLALGAWAAYTWLGVGSPIHTNEYQAVYTTDGKAYFGKISNLSGTYLQLDDVYYFKSASPPQGGSSTAQATSPQLVQLGQEIHKPHNTMYIKSSQVIWWENIQNDGKVTQAIQADKARHP